MKNKWQGSIINVFIISFFFGKLYIYKILNAWNVFIIYLYRCYKSHPLIKKCMWLVSEVRGWNWFALRIWDTFNRTPVPPGRKLNKCANCTDYFFGDKYALTNSMRAVALNIYLWCCNWFLIILIGRLFSYLYIYIYIGIGSSYT